MNIKYEILFCSRCLKPFNAQRSFLCGGFSSRVDTVSCPHCGSTHDLCTLRNEQTEIKKCLTKLKKTLDI